ncbi:MAG: hypothetical protein AAFP82_16715, partial [Bacteroidota bacterium]
SKMDRIQLLYYVANRIYFPSYISLHTALNWYGFIPEGVFSITSVSTKKTNEFRTPLGNFVYKKVKPSIYFGYSLQTIQNRVFKIATPAKAILDILYLYPEYNTKDDFFELRFNIEEIQTKVNWQEWENYLALFDQKQLNKRAQLLRKFIAE